MLLKNNNLVLISMLLCACSNNASNASKVTQKPDLDPPYVKTTLPGNGEYAVLSDTNIRIVFSEAMDTNSFSTDNINVYLVSSGTQESRVPIKTDSDKLHFTYDTEEKSLTFATTTVFGELSDFKIELTADAENGIGFWDMAGNILVANTDNKKYVWTFSTSPEPSNTGGSVTPPATPPIEPIPSFSNSINTTYTLNNTTYYYDDIGLDLEKTSDNGFILSGTSRGGSWVEKINKLGEFEWGKFYNTVKIDHITQLSEQSYIAIGSISVNSQNGIVILQIDTIGNIQLQKVYLFSDKLVVSDFKVFGGNYYLVGSTNYGIVTSDVWVARIDATGKIIWQNAYGGSNSEVGNAIEISNDNKLIVASSTSSSGSGSNDVWLLKLDTDGNIIWQKTLGGKKSDSIQAIKRVTGGYIVAGGTTSSGNGGEDAFMAKLDENGNPIWQNVYGTTNDEYFARIKTDSSANYTVIGASYLGTAGLSSSDALILSTDKDGKILWQKTVRVDAPSEADMPEKFSKIQPTADDGNMVLGGIGSLQNGMIQNDIWLSKIDQDGSIALSENSGFKSSNAQNISSTTDMVLADSTLPSTAYSATFDATTITASDFPTLYTEPHSASTTTLATPENLAAVPDLNYVAINLTWTATTDAHFGYVLFRSEDNKYFQRIATLKPDAVAFYDADISLKRNTTYYYKLELYNNTGYSDFSTVATVTTIY